MVAAITWAVIALEFALFAGLLAKLRYRLTLLWMGLLFHATIALFHGLISFSIAMSGALVLYLWPLERPFRFPDLFGERFWREPVRCSAAIAGVGPETGTQHPSN